MYLYTVVCIPLPWLSSRPPPHGTDGCNEICRCCGIDFVRRDVASVCIITRQLAHLVGAVTMPVTLRLYRALHHRLTPASAENHLLPHSLPPAKGSHSSQASRKKAVKWMKKYAENNSLWLSTSRNYQICVTVIDWNNRLMWRGMYLYISRPHCVIITLHLKHFWPMSVVLRMIVTFQ